MKRERSQPVKLVNPLNQETWYCDNYRETVNLEGVEYVKVHNPSYANNRKFLMRKDALRKITMG